jgi:RNA polymerase sigma-70 factor (ECF subfamily)
MPRVTSIPDASLVVTALTLAAEDTTKAPNPHLHEKKSTVTLVTIETLHHSYARSIHRFLCDMLGDPSSARDATQETFVRAFQRLHTLESHQRPAPWLYGIARNVSLEFRRARRRRRRVLDDNGIEVWEDNRAAEDASGSPEDQAIRSEALRLVEDALGELSHDRRTVLLLRVDHDMSCDDIAAAMGWSVSKVKVEIHRARQVLREAIQKIEGGRR